MRANAQHALAPHFTPHPCTPHAGLEVDLLIVGGGIHGAGIARDAAGRGLSVLLVEQGDLAGATSSASSKLAHGGLRYLELGDFRLVREALRERETLMRIAPHLVWPLPFFLPRSPATRPGWQIRAGLLLYDWLSRAKPPSAQPDSGFVRHSGGRASQAAVSNRLLLLRRLGGRCAAGRCQRHGCSAARRHGDDAHALRPGTPWGRRVAGAADGGRGPAGGGQRPRNRERHRSMGGALPARVHTGASCPSRLAWSKAVMWWYGAGCLATAPCCCRTTMAALSSSSRSRASLR